MITLARPSQRICHIHSNLIQRGPNPIQLSSFQLISLAFYSLQLTAVNIKELRLSSNYPRLGSSPYDLDGAYHANFNRLNEVGQVKLA